MGIYNNLQIKSLLSNIRNKCAASLVLFYFSVASLPLHFLSLNASTLLEEKDIWFYFPVAGKNEKIIMDQVAILLQWYQSSSYFFRIDFWNVVETLAAVYYTYPVVGQHSQYINTIVLALVPLCLHIGAKKLRDIKFEIMKIPLISIIIKFIRPVAKPSFQTNLKPFYLYVYVYWPTAYKLTREHAFPS